MRKPTRRIAAVSALTALALLVAACGGNDDAAQPAGKSDALAQPPETTPTPTPSPGATPGAGATVGEACARLPQSGPGSLNEMATKPVAEAVASNPELAELSKALESAGLSDQLDQAQDVTLFAPINDAWRAVPDATMNNPEELSGLLEHHVVEERLTPDNIEGEHQTMQGDPITVTKAGDQIKVDDATVVCGNIPTANGVIYMVDKTVTP